MNTRKRFVFITGNCIIGSMEYTAVIVAAGVGRRTLLDYNKVFYEIEEGSSILDLCLSPFLKDSDCKQIVLVCAKDEIEYMNEQYGHLSNLNLCIGGATRQESVFCGLKETKYPYVFIHDGARPYLKESSLVALKETLEKEEACLLVVPMVDTPKVVKDGYVQTTLERSTIYRAQTPQCFKTDLIIRCHQLAQEQGFKATDDSQLAEYYGNKPVKMVLGDEENVKITLPKDLVR